MFAINTYEEIEKTERSLNKRHIIVFLFVRPNLEGAAKIIEQFNYLHHNSQQYCSIYAIGYSENADKNTYTDFQKVKGINGTDWYYSDQAFVEFKDKLETRLKWRYSGEIEMLILQSNPTGHEILNFQNYLSIDVNYGIRKKYIDSFPRFMEDLIRISKNYTTVTLTSMVLQKYPLKEIMAETIENCKQIPWPVKRIIKDRLFYRPANHTEAK